MKDKIILLHKNNPHRDNYEIMCSPRRSLKKVGFEIQNIFHYVNRCYDYFTFPCHILSSNYGRCNGQCLRVLWLVSQEK